jgi:hypothetical protein
MTTASPSHDASWAVVNAIPDGKKSLTVLFALKGVIEFGQYLIGPLHVSTG